MKWIAVPVAALTLAACGGEGAVTRPAVRDATDAALKRTEPLRDLYSAHSRMCRRVTLERYRDAVTGQSTDDASGC